MQTQKNELNFNGQSDLDGIKHLNLRDFLSLNDL